MKILFIYPDIITKMINFCPAIHVLSAVLKAEGCEVEMLHINNEYGIKYDKQTIINLSKGYDLYAITSTSFNYKYANEIAGWIRDNGRLVMLGGYHATTQPDDFESSNFDIFCIGEGEEPMKDLVHALRSGDDWTKIPNLITRSSHNPVRGFLRDMNKLPFWDFEITDTKKILQLRGGWLSISFSRGCNYECSFCYNHLLKKVELGANDKMSDYLRRRKPDLVIAELLSLVAKYDVKFLNIDDDLLTLNKKWMRDFTEFYKEIIFKPFGVRYVINARADSLTDDLVQQLSESGCKEVRLGFETGSETLRNQLLQKKISNDSLERACNLLDKYNIQSVAFAMMGIPGETWDTFYDTLKATIQLKPKLIRMTFLFPYKHTLIHDICIQRDILKENYENEDNRDLRSPLRFENITDDELFCFRFLFPWFVNELWFNDHNYSDAIWYFGIKPLFELENCIPEIIAKDKELSAKCNHAHYRYFSGNPDYFELYENSTDKF
jgi:anaerobic magnesium-protoporphyrin IX monomethyl ester cyclase